MPGSFVLLVFQWCGIICEIFFSFKLPGGTVNPIFFQCAHQITWKWFDVWWQNIYNPFRLLLNFVVLFGRWILNLSSSFESNVTQSFLIMSLSDNMLVIASSSYHTYPYCGTSEFWLFILTPAFFARSIS